MSNPVLEITHGTARISACLLYTSSAGSILGAVLGKSAIAPELYECFHDRMDTYLKNTEAFSIRDMAKRYSALAHKVHSRL